VTSHDPAHDPTRLGGVGEIAEDEATGVIASAYAQVRELLGVPFVPTIYRMIAVHEGAFVEALARLAPVLAAQKAEAFISRAEAVARQALGSTPEDGPEGVDPQTSLLVERYSTANPLGLLFVIGLLGTDVVRRSGVMAPPLPARSNDIFTDVRQCYGGVIVPGFWRELGQRPEVLEQVWSATRAHAERSGFDAASRAVFEYGVATIRSAGVGSVLSDLPSREAHQIRELLGWFPTGISTMIAVTEWFRSHDQSAPTANGATRG